MEDTETPPLIKPERDKGWGMSIPVSGNCFLFTGCASILTRGGQSAKKIEKKRYKISGFTPQHPLS